MACLFSIHFCKHHCTLSQKPFTEEEKLTSLTARLNELNALLNVDKRENEIRWGRTGRGGADKAESKRHGALKARAEKQPLLQK